MSVASKQPPAKDWCFTINNPLEKDWNKVWNFDYHYLVFQVEVGEEGTPHLQGFVQWNEKIRLSALKKFHKRAHWEKRRGSASEASHYCKKPVDECTCKHCDGLERFDLEVYEDGNISEDPVAELATALSVMKAKGLSHTIERYPAVFVRYHAGMEKLATFYSKKRDFVSQVTVCWGEPDSGKTRYAMLGPSPYVLAAFGGEGQADFFGDYRPDEHQTLVVDDFYSSWRFTTFLRVCDRYPTEVHTKGGFRQLLVSHIVFTSNLSPNEWYPNVTTDPTRKESFFRRIQNIIHFTKAGYAISKV